MNEGEIQSRDDGLVEAHLQFLEMSDISTHLEKVAANHERRKRIAFFLAETKFIFTEIAYEFKELIKTKEGRMDLYSEIQDYFIRARTYRLDNDAPDNGESSEY